MNKPQTNLHKLQVRIPLHLYNDLERLIVASGKTRSQIVRELLTKIK